MPGSPCICLGAASAHTRGVAKGLHFSLTAQLLYMVPNAYYGTLSAMQSWWILYD